MEVYMQSLEPEVRRAINSIHDELMATGTDDSEVPPPATQKATGAINPAETVLEAMELQPAEEGKEETKKMPSRCKIIPFAGKMRANVWGLSANLLEDLVDLVGIEPTTSSMPWKRAPNCATGPTRESLFSEGYFLLSFTE
jgi:hypothetical protein